MNRKINRYKPLYTPARINRGPGKRYPLCLWLPFGAWNQLAYKRGKRARGAGTLKNTNTASLVSRAPQSILEHRYADYKEKSSLLHRPHSLSTTPPLTLTSHYHHQHNHYYLSTPPPLLPLNTTTIPFLTLFPLQSLLLLHLYFSFSPPLFRVYFILTHVTRVKKDLLFCYTFPHLSTQVIKV